MKIDRKIIVEIPGPIIIRGEIEMIKALDFQVYRGTDATILLQVRQGAQAYGDISEFKLHFTARDKVTDQVVILKRNLRAGGSDDEIDMENAATSLARILLPRSDTASLPANQYLKYDIMAEMPEADGRTIVLAHGEIFIIENQTRL
jgi:hypothetical protein